MANNQNLLDARLRPPNGTRQPPPPSHPSRGGNLYSDDLCWQVLQMYFDNVDLRDAPELIPLAVCCWGIWRPQCDGQRS